MRKLFIRFIILNFILIMSCDDGDVITFELDFEDTFEACDGGEDLVFYKTKDDPSESLSLKLDNVNLEDIFNVDETGFFENTYTISSTNPFNYRTYSNSSLPTDLFCNVIPNSEVDITQDIESTSGEALLTTILTEDDEDGIDAELEKPENNPLLEGKEDFDGDGLANYIDADDDGDNILTKNENPDPDGDGDLSDAQDTDGDGIPDYLDEDDDGDGINTRDEENDSQDQNPANDFTVSEIADYLNPDITEVDGPKATAYRAHTIIQTYTVTLLISDIDLELIALDDYDFGVLDDENTTDSRTLTPEFP